MKALFARIKSKAKQIPRRTLVLVVIFILLFSVPTILAIRSMKGTETTPQKSNFSVVLSDQSRSPFASSMASEDPTNGSNLADVFYRIITEATPVDVPPSPPESGTPLYVTTNFNGKPTEYTCYFSLSGKNSYFLDSNGNVFLITVSSATEFLLLPESEYLYNGAKLPKLLTNTLEEIVPSNASWYYKLYDGEYKPATTYTTTEDTRSYGFSGALEIVFEKEPDISSVRAVEASSGQVVYEGAPQGLSSIIVDPGTTLQISLQAEWGHTNEAESYGAISYYFSAIIHDRSTFSLNKTAISSGDFLILTCTNIQSIDKLSMQSTHALTRYTYATGNTVYFVIPFPTDMTASTLNFSVTYGASTSNFTVSILEHTEANDVTIPHDDIIRRAISAQAQNELSALFAQSYTSSHQSIYFHGNILPMTEYGFTQGYTFGDRLTAIDTSTVLSAVGTEYLASVGTAIPALASGKVVSIGHCDALGYYVILDHGLGIQTWYAHLSDFDVHVGDIVSIGQSIGKAGIGGVYSESGVLVLCTVNGHLCDPKSILQ